MTATIKRPAEALCAAVNRLPRHRWSAIRTTRTDNVEIHEWKIELECRECGFCTTALVWDTESPPWFGVRDRVPPCQLKFHLD